MFTPVNLEWTFTGAKICASSFQAATPFFQKWYTPGIFCISGKHMSGVIFRSSADFIVRVRVHAKQILAGLLNISPGNIRETLQLALIRYTQTGDRTWRYRNRELDTARLCHCIHNTGLVPLCPNVTVSDHLDGPAVKPSASIVGGSGFESRSSHTIYSFKNGILVATLPDAWRHCMDWSARCQYTMTGRGSKFHQQLLSQCDSSSNCLNRSDPRMRFACCWDRKWPRAKTNSTVMSMVHHRESVRSGKGGWFASGLLMNILCTWKVRHSRNRQQTPRDMNTMTQWIKEMMD